MKIVQVNVKHKHCMATEIGERRQRYTKWVVLLSLLISHSFISMWGSPPELLFLALWFTDLYRKDPWAGERSTGESTCCYSRGSGLSSQHPHDCWQWQSIIQAQGFIALSGFQGHCNNVIDKTGHSYEFKKKKRFLKEYSITQSFRGKKKERKCPLQKSQLTNQLSTFLKIFLHLLCVPTHIGIHMVQHICGDQRTCKFLLHGSTGSYSQAWPQTPCPLSQLTSS